MSTEQQETFTQPRQDRDAELVAYDRLSRENADAQERLRAVEALADEWWSDAEYGDHRPSTSRAMHAMVAELRALWARVCPDCGGTITTSQGRHEARCIRAACRYVGDGALRAALAPATSPAEQDAEP